MLQMQIGRHEEHVGANLVGAEPPYDYAIADAALPMLRNRSTGNLPVMADCPRDPPFAKNRMSLDTTSTIVADYNALARSASLIDHEHGPGLSGLRCIRQRLPSKLQTLPNSSASRRSSMAAASSRLPSASATLTTKGACAHPSLPNSPSFSEDLSRFPSESLHSFSFAHQAEDLMHSRQSILKRSLDFMKDRLGWSESSTHAELANVQAKLAADVDVQHVLDLLNTARLLGTRHPKLAHPPTPLGSIKEPSEPTIAIPSDVRVIAERAVSGTDASEVAVPALLAPCPADRVDFTKDPTHADHNVVRQDERRSSDAIAAHANDDPAANIVFSSRPPTSRAALLRRTMTDSLALPPLHRQASVPLSPPVASTERLCDDTLVSPNILPHAVHPSQSLGTVLGSPAHGHTNRWVPAAQAIFTTEAKPPWTIIAANDLACLVFGVTKAEVRKLSILEVVQEERRAWLEQKLLRRHEVERDGDYPDDPPSPPLPPLSHTPAASAASTLLAGRTGLTARLLGKPNPRALPPILLQRRAQTVHAGDIAVPKILRGTGQHRNNPSRGVLLCGDVIPIQKRNGATGSASLWVKEKRIGLIWVLEEIYEDVASVTLDEEGTVTSISGAADIIWGSKAAAAHPGLDVSALIPRIPRQGIDPTVGEIDFAQISRRKYYTCSHATHVSLPCKVEQVPGQVELKVSTFPHMAGIVVLDPENLRIRSSNPIFCGALFGHERPEGLPISHLIPDFDRILNLMVEEDGLEVMDGTVVPEQRFRRASALLATKDQRPHPDDASARPNGLRARHRDGSELKIDVQMRVVESEKQSDVSDEDASGAEDAYGLPRKEMMFALWITYSRHLHAHGPPRNDTPPLSRASTPLHQPSPGQAPPTYTPTEIASDADEPAEKETAVVRTVEAVPQVKTINITAKLAKHLKPLTRVGEKKTPTSVVEAVPKANINDYTILEDMGQGAYGQVKLARHKQTGKKAVLKYVTKRRILVDTWTRDRRLGTVPLEIHVLDYLRRPEFRHPNIVEMQGFFEDDVNYYIEMTPHGLPGMDLFDYIELRANMGQPECRSIFVQVAQAIHFLHTKALVVHRDIKDENVILDGEGNIRLIDFGSAAYIKSGPFDVFVGTIDYAAPEVLAGKPYGGKEQDVWALGILLYTIIYKENPFYSIDEIMDRDLRVPFTMSDESIDLVRRMLNRDVRKRLDINQVLQHPWCKVA